MAKVFVGLSGGVDSAVAAHLLLAQGHEVTGVFIKIWQPEFLECTWEEDRLSAKRVAAALGISFREIDCSAEYKEEVIRDLIQGYESGVTPNPDVLCNQHIKFGTFLQWALAEGADYIATGHYARIVKRDDQYELHRGKDISKDQSYFLHRLTQKELSHALFPVGEYTKAEIRHIAENAGLPNAKRPDSQGLCFIGEVSIGDFLERFIPLHEGPILNTNGTIVGTHQGIARYTIGQRHGFTIHAHASSTESPQYVIAIRAAENSLTVSDRIEDAFRTRVEISDIRWTNRTPVAGTRYRIEARYHQKEQYGYLEIQGMKTYVVLESPQILAAGQFAVFYERDQCLGGGVICA